MEEKQHMCNENMSVILERMDNFKDTYTQTLASLIEENDENTKFRLRFERIIEDEIMEEKLNTEHRILHEDKDRKIQRLGITNVVGWLGLAIALIKIIHESLVI